MSFKEKLRDEILPKAVEYYNSGVGMNESVVKTAEDFNLNLEQVDRLVETMNTARTIAHYEKNAEDRTQNFEIADKDAVRRLLVSEPAEKKASAGDQAWYDYSFYDSEETDRRSAYSGTPELVKAAEAIEDRNGVKALSERQVVSEVVAYADRLEGLRKFASSRADMAESDIATNISKIASMLSRGYDSDARYAMFKTSLSLAKKASIIPSIEAEIPDYVVKAAEPHMKALRRMNVVDDSSVEAEVKMACDALDDMEIAAKLRKEAERYAKEEAGLRKKIAEYGELVGGKVDFFGVKSAAPAGVADGKKDDKKDAGKKKQDPWFGKAVSNMVPDAPSGVKNMYEYLQGGALDPKKLDDLLNPPKQKSTELKEYVNNMRRSDIITELYNEDPILSEADPDAVSKAYATLVQSAPEASLNKEVVRAILRQSVNSVAVSPFDVKQWADLDKTTLENRKLNAQLSGRAKL